MTLDQLIATAAARYQFRRQLRRETAAAYRVALINHVEARDYAAAYELRIGKPQAEWTTAEVRDFKTHILQVPRVKQDFAPGAAPMALAVMPIADGVTVSDDELARVAGHGLTAVIQRRIAEPGWEVPILISALLMNGSLVATSSARGDRIAVLKYLARETPLFGYFIVADMFLHTVNDQIATKAEGLVMHLRVRLGPPVDRPAIIEKCA